MSLSTPQRRLLNKAYQARLDAYFYGMPNGVSRYFSHGNTIKSLMPDLIEEFEHRFEEDGSGGLFYRITEAGCNALGYPPNFPVDKAITIPYAKEMVKAWGSIVKNNTVRCSFVVLGERNFAEITGRLCSGYHIDQIGFGSVYRSDIIFSDPPSDPQNRWQHALPGFLVADVILTSIG